MKLNELTESIDSTMSELVATYTGGDFYCDSAELTSLEGCPKEITGDFKCSFNKLISLEGGPTEITGDFFCFNNKLTSLEYCPTIVHGKIYCGENKITSLVGIHKHLKSCKELYFTGDKIVEGGLGLLLIKNLTTIPTRTEPFKIISKYLGQGVKGLPKCQQELIDAGYKEFAKL